MSERERKISLESIFSGHQLGIIFSPPTPSAPPKTLNVDLGEAIDLYFKLDTIQTTNYGDIKRYIFSR